MPGLIASALYIGVSVMSDFGNPMIVAGRYKVLAVEIYTQLTGWMNGGVSAVLGLILIIPSVVLFYFQNRLLNKTQSKLAVISGNSHISDGERQNSPSVFARILLTVFCSFITLCIILQFLSIIAGSFQKLWGIDTAFTLKHLKTVQNCGTELWNTVRFSTEAAFLSTLIALFASFFVFRTKLPLKKYIDALIQLPSAVPGTLFGLAWAVFFAKLKFHKSIACSH